MKKTFVTRQHQKRLILIFLGWGMESAPFSEVNKPGYDILMVCDYADFDLAAETETLCEELSGYEEIVVLAWSFGVRIASELLPGLKQTLPVTRTIAINGTTTHIHNSEGIPTAIFNGTLAALSPQSIRKFQRRMFSSQAEFQRFRDACEGSAERPFNSLLAELQFFSQLEPVEANPKLWSIALIGTNDAIFPPENQQKAWHSVRNKIIEGMPHCPDFQAIIDREVIDKELVTSRFSKAATTYGDNAHAQTIVARNLWHFVSEQLPDPASEPMGKILEIGAGTGILTNLYSRQFAGSDMELWDIAPVAPCTMPPNARFKCCDAETEIRHQPAGQFDIIISTSTLQWFNSATSFLREAMRVLRRGGLLAVSAFGSSTYREISGITGITLNYPTLPELTQAIEGDSKIIVAEDSLITEEFNDVASLLRHIKLTGVNALPPQSAADTLRLMRQYPTNPDGRALLTYHPIYLIARKPTLD